LGVENGRFFIFQRSGQNFETQYHVKVYKQKLEVQGLGVVEKDLSHTLTADIIARLDAETFNLDKLFKTPTAEQVAAIIKGGPAAVEEILGKKDQQEEISEDEPDSDVQTLLSSVSVPSVSTAPTQTTLPTSGPTTAGVTVVQPVTTVTPPQVQVSQTTAPGAGMTAEEFLKSMGL